MIIIRVSVSDSASDMEFLAAGVLRDYCRRISGSEIPLLSTDSSRIDAEGTVLVGLPSTNTQIGNLVRSRKIRNPERNLKPEGFLIETLIDGGLSKLVITGRDPKGVLNGVYHLLQEFLGVGFFRDGQRVPTRETLTVPELSIASSPRFSIRGELLWGYLGPQRFCSSSWPLEQWQKALDWQTQKRMNTIEISLPIELVFPDVFPEIAFQWHGPWTPDFTRQHVQSILEYGRSRGVRFMYEVWYTKLSDDVRRLYPDLDWHDEFLCAAQPESRELSKRVWESVIDTFGTDHLYTVRYRGEEGQPYSPECGDMLKWRGYVQAYEMLKSLDSKARIAAWSWAEKPEEMWPHFPDDLECQHMKHGLHGEWRFPGLGRDVPPGRPPIAEGRPWINALFSVFSGTETKLLTSLSDPSWIVDDARLSGKDPECDGYMLWPEWTNTSQYLFDLVAELAWDPDSVTVEGHIQRYTRLRYGDEGAGEMADSLQNIVLAGSAQYTYTPSRRNVSLWHASAQHLDQMKHIYASLTDAFRALDQLATDALYANHLFDLTAYYLYQLAWYFEARAYFHHLEATKSKDTTAMVESGAEAVRAWSDLLTLYSTRDDYSLFQSADLMRSKGPTQDNFIETFIEQGTEFYYGYPLCASQEEVAYFCRPQCEAFLEALEYAVSSGKRYDGGEPARWYWHDFDESWREFVVGMPFPDPDLFRRKLKAALDARTPLVEGSSQSTIEVLRRVIPGLPNPESLPAVSLSEGRASLT